MSTPMIWTTAGFAALVNADNTGTLPVECKYIALGTGTTAADKADTALQSEFKRIQTISGTVVDNNVIHVVLRDESMDAYNATEIGLIDADGTLLARYAQATPIITKAANATALLAIDASFTEVDAAQISFGDIQFTNPPWGEDTQGVVKKATQAQAEAGEDNSVGMTPRRTVELLQSEGIKELLRDIAHPIGSVYIQYPEQATPSSLFGGHWEKIFDKDGVFFRTEGGGASDFENGIQSDAIRNIKGQFDLRAADATSGTPHLMLNPTSPFILNDASYMSGASIITSGATHTADRVTFDASKVVPTASENRPKNITIRIWRRVS